ncbi:uncharacterized protein LOC123551442 [Mercenaria mercenaria]|uniref:uncharacterized protein LOC123551442 n=1 Tax=Mercenaria mercenaria TaxID=6596 RepID=UPI00234F7FF0|nr:uncharacterized protein LOC123551442 [Mercenaria mercenaria]
MPPQMSSEKFIRAERKNRLETHRLKVTYRHYDKETVRLNYEIDREKRSITKSFRNVIKTSGASDLGIPPKNDKDTDFEKCPSYMQGLKLSNKRLMEWRECEKQLDKFIMHHELERAKQKRKKCLKKKNPGFEFNPPKKFNDIDDDVFVDNERLLTNDASSPVDILKDNPSNSSEVFDIKKWESDIIDSYKSMVCQNPHVTSNEGDTKYKLKSKSSPTFSSRISEPDEEKKKRVRPHTAQPRIRPSSGRLSTPQRPASATVRSESQSPFLITKDSIYIKTGQSFEKLVENRPVDTPVMVNNYLDAPSLKPPATNTEKEPSIASISTLCPVQEGNEEDETDDVATDKMNEDERDTEAHSDDEKNDQTVSTALGENKMQSELSLKFQLRMRQKLERTRSASSGMIGQMPSNRNHFKQSNSDLSSYVEGSRRTRRDSGSASSMISMPMSRTGSFVSSHRPSESLGIAADIEEIQRGQDKLLSEIKPEKPLSTNKLVSVTKIVRAALTFSRVARKRALQKMQNENSSDAHEIVRQERIRKLQSRQNVLNTIASQWQTDPSTLIEQVE